MPLPADFAPSLLARLTPRQSEIERWIRRAVEIESPSNDKPSLDRMADFLGDEFSAIGGRIKIHKSLTAGDQVQIDFPSRRGGKPVLVLGHHDTVWELGTLKSMPCHVTQGRIWGPGTLDMKAGLAQVLFALRALREHFAGFPRPVTILSVSDEETGSHASRAVTESLAKKSSAVLVLEPAQGLEGALKTARKGVGEYSLKVHGRAAHAGVDFPSGGSAIVELARQIQQVAKLTNLKRGLTLNPGVIRGGTRSNVIAAEAEAQIDVRIARPADAKFVESKLSRLRPFDARCRIEISGRINRPPMERTRGVAALFAQARTLAAGMNGAGGRPWVLEESSTGGASDGNFTAALGVPTLDGLGAVGEGAHAAHESVVLSEIPRRAALLAALIASI